MKSELQKFQKSPEYKTFIKKVTNKRVSLEEKILWLYKEWVDTTELDYNMHNHYYEIANTFRTAIDEIKSQETWATEFKKELIGDIEKYEQGIVGQMNNWYWAPYSSMQLTKVDLMRSKVVGYKIIEELLEWMIQSADKPEEPKIEWAF